jgi:hypothetical protein
MLNTVRRFIYTKYWEILYVEHCWKIYSHKILGNTLCWTLLEDLITQNTGKYLMLNTVGRFIYTKYWGILYVEHSEKIYLHKILGNTWCKTLLEDSFTQNTRKYFMLNTVGRFIYTKYWEYFMLNTVRRFIYTKYREILSVKHCREIYLHKILGNTLCWTQWEDLFTQNTGEYFMLNTVGRFIYTKYWGIVYVEHSEKIYLHKILGNTWC